MTARCASYRASVLNLNKLMSLVLCAKVVHHVASGAWWECRNEDWIRGGDVKALRPMLTSAGAARISVSNPGSPAAAAAQAAAQLFGTAPDGAGGGDSGGEGSSREGSPLAIPTSTQRTPPSAERQSSPLAAAAASPSPSPAAAAAAAALAAADEAVSLSSEDGFDGAEDPGSSSIELQPAAWRGGHAAAPAAGRPAAAGASDSEDEPVLALPLPSAAHHRQQQQAGSWAPAGAAAAGALPEAEASGEMSAEASLSNFSPNNVKPPRVQATVRAFASLTQLAAW